MRGGSKWNYRGIISKMGYRHDNLSVGKVGMGGKNLIMIFIITLDILMVHTG